MRPFKTLLLLIAAIVSVLAACRKDTIKPDAGARTGSPKSEDCNFDVTIECGMLSFTDAAHFTDVQECLDERYEAFLAWLDQEYGNLEDDDFEDAVDQLGTNEDQEIISFLNSLGFYSYWNMYEDALNSFLDQGGEPWNFTVSNPFATPIDAALRNELGAIMIGGVIHVTQPDGNEWTFCSCEAYEIYAADPENYIDDPNDPCDEFIVKEIFQGTGGIECADDWKMCHWNHYATRKQMKVKLLFGYETSEGTSAHARLDSWKQRNNGKYRRRYTKLYPRVYGESTSLSCESRGYFDKDKSQRRARSRWVTLLWDGQHRAFRNQGVHGAYTWSGGAYSDQITLDWNEPLCWN